MNESNIGTVVKGELGCHRDRRGQIKGTELYALDVGGSHEEV